MRVKISKVEKHIVKPRYEADVLSPQMLEFVKKIREEFRFQNTAPRIYTVFLKFLKGVFRTHFGRILTFYIITVPPFEGHHFFNYRVKKQWCNFLQVRTLTRSGMAARQIWKTG